MPSGTRGDSILTPLETATKVLEAIEAGCSKEEIKGAAESGTLEAFSKLIAQQQSANISNQNPRLSTSSLGSQESGRSKLSASTDDSQLEGKSSTPMKRGAKPAAMSTPGGHVRTQDQRPRTIIGPQVEHAIAYVLLEELIYSSIEGRTRDNAIIALSESFSNLPISSPVMKQIMAQLNDMEEGLITREQRKDITRAIRGNNLLSSQKEEISKLTASSTNQDISNGLDRLSEIDADVVKSSIITSNKYHLSNIVTNIMDLCLKGANKMPYVNFPTEGVPSNPNTGNEKSAKNDLRLLSDFLEDVKEIHDLKNQDQKSGNNSKSQEKIDEVLSDEKRLKKIFKSWGKVEGKDNKSREWGFKDMQQIMSLVKGEKSLDRIFNNIELGIAINMDNLFYFPVLSNPHRYEIDGETQDWSVSKEDWNKVMNVNPETGKSGKNRKYNLGTKPRSNNPEVMFEVAANYIVVSMNCFRGLSCFNKKNQEEITNNFLTNSLLRKGWNGFKIDNEEDLDLRETKRGISDYAELQYENGEFYSKKSLKSFQNQTQILESKGGAIR